VLSTPVPRGRWLGEYGAVGLIAAMVVIVAAVIGAVLGATSADDPADVSATAIEAAVAQLPAVLVYLGLGLLLFVLVPRATIAAAWALLALGAFFGVFGELIGLPDWVRELSPFAHSPVPVGDDIDWSGGAWMLALGIAGIVAAIAAMRRRELASGG
jgi:ABC-2 type transport system permease protein